MQLCKNKNVDTRTRTQKDTYSDTEGSRLVLGHRRIKKREQDTDDAPRSSSRQRDRQRATGKNDKNRQQVDDHEHEDDTADMTTSVSE